MPTDFAIASGLEPIGEHLYRADIPDGWQQGRGAFGGLVLGTLLRAMEHSEPDGARRPRTLSGDLCGPVLPGAAEVRVRLLRRGSNQSNVAAELWQGGAILATATAVLSPARTAIERRLLEPPPPGRWQEAEVIAVGPPVGPVFAMHYEYRGQGTPFGATGEALAGGWIRERVPLARLDAAAIVGRLDAWWPTIFHLDGVPRPIATISFVAQLVADPKTLAPDEPLRYRARMATLSDGFFLELRELWQGDTPVAMNQQTFAILR